MADLHIVIAAQSLADQNKITAAQLAAITAQAQKLEADGPVTVDQRRIADRVIADLQGQNKLSAGEAQALILEVGVVQEEEAAEKLEAATAAGATKKTEADRVAADKAAADKAAAKAAADKAAAAAAKNL